MIATIEVRRSTISAMQGYRLSAVVSNTPAIGTITAECVLFELLIIYPFKILRSAENFKSGNS